MSDSALPALDADRFDAATFLRDHWQKRPLLIRNPWRDWRNPLAPDELAGLACEKGVEARLVVRKRTTWHVAHGPFKPKRFARLGRKPWTLLVQAVDHAVPAVAALVAPFRFIPNWRIDDIMVSVAGHGGGVGPHFDQYDVFLVQGHGRRRWQVGRRCDAATALLPHDDLRLLAAFEPIDEWILDPGDILYLPPGVAHDGVALGDDCMTYSIGFRAPSRSELIAHWCDHVLAGLDDDDRYTDPDLPIQTDPGEIAAEAIARAHLMVSDRLLDRDAFGRWFGEYTSAPKDADADWRPEAATSADDLRAALAAGLALDRNPASRFAFIRHGAGAVSLFVDGACFDCAGDVAAFAERLCASDRVEVDPRLAMSEPAMTVLAALLGKGCIAFAG